jgi:hypothetical protein
MVAPQYEALSGKYPDVLFTKVVQDNNPEICETEGEPTGEQMIRKTHAEGQRGCQHTRPLCRLVF